MLGILKGTRDMMCSNAWHYCCMTARLIELLTFGTNISISGYLHVTTYVWESVKFITRSTFMRSVDVNVLMGYFFRLLVKICFVCNTRLVLPRLDFAVTFSYLQQPFLHTQHILWSCVLPCYVMLC